MESPALREAATRDRRERGLGLELLGKEAFRGLATLCLFPFKI